MLTSDVEYFMGGGQSIQVCALNLLGFLSSSLPSLPFTSQINNKVCGTVLVPQQVTQDTEQVRALVLGSELGQHLLGYRTIKKAILFPRTALINFLIEERPLHPRC